MVDVQVIGSNAGGQEIRPLPVGDCCRVETRA
jgi:hypothetical protein